MRRRRKAITASALEVADAIDLFALACRAGLSVGGALRVVAAHLDGVLGAALAETVRQTDDGTRLSEALAALPDTAGEVVRPLSSALTMSVRYGSPVVPALERASIEIRANHRRDVDVRARRLPVKLIFPLVLCCLPAFVLLSVVPFLIVVLKDLSQR